MKTLAIIGSTGSIGKSSLNVYKKNKKNFKLLCLAAYSNFKKLKSQKKLFKPQNILLLKNNKINKKLISKDSFIKKYKKKKIDYVISGLSGFEAINFNFELIKISKNLLIANKETIICGGKVFIDYAKKNNCKIVPIDSEHHCLDFFLKTNLIKKQIDKFFITASGGPFFDKKINFNESIKNVINHPTWKMGKKISVDSSTFANKALELFEAKILFNLDPDSLEVIVDTKSLSHNVIKFKNNIFFAIIHEPNMEIPISNSLNVKNKNKLKIEGLDISLKKANLKKFPTLDIGYRILKSNSPSLMIFLL